MSQHQIERDAEIMLLVEAGHGNRQIAKLSKCSHQNIDQIRRRMSRQSRPALRPCVKISDAERVVLRDTLRFTIRLAMGFSPQEASDDLDENPLTPRA